MILALIEYDKKGNPVVVKSPMETTHEGWIERGKIADEAILSIAFKMVLRQFWWKVFAIAISENTFSENIY